MNGRSTGEEFVERSARARLSLEGLSVGDAFGERFFHAGAPVGEMVDARILPGAPWRYTDDTAMALAITDLLEERGRIDQNALADRFARDYEREPWRGYGRGMHEMLSHVRQGSSWKRACSVLFGGEGSLGNGAAMRVAPLGAWFADDFERAAAEARLSAEVTHAHREGRAGAIAVAVAAAWAWSVRGGEMTGREGRLFDAVLPLVPGGSVRHGILTASQLPLTTALARAVAILGNGGRVTAADTVPLTLWLAARHLYDYEEAIWHAVAALGDIDTNAAIVGGIVSLSAGYGSIPEDWREAREPLPEPGGD